MSDDNDDTNPCTVDSHGAWSAPYFDSATQSAYDSGYFWYHHSDADTIERLDPHQLNANAAALAIWTFAIAELPELLPRNDPATSNTKSDDDSKNSFLQRTDKVLLYLVVPVVIVLFAMVIVGYQKLYLTDDQPRQHHPLSDPLVEGNSI